MTTDRTVQSKPADLDQRIDVTELCCQRPRLPPSKIQKAHGNLGQNLAHEISNYWTGRWSVVTLKPYGPIMGCLIRQIADGWLDYISSKSSSHFPRGPPPSSPLLPLPFFLPPFRGETPREKREQAAKEIASTSPVAPDRAPNSLFCRGFGAATFLEFFCFWLGGRWRGLLGLDYLHFCFPQFVQLNFLTDLGIEARGSALQLRGLCIAGFALFRGRIAALHADLCLGRPRNSPTIVIPSELPRLSSRISPSISRCPLHKLSLVAPISRVLHACIPQRRWHSGAAAKLWIVVPSHPEKFLRGEKNCCCISQGSCIDMVTVV